MRRGTTPTIRWYLGRTEAEDVTEAFMTIQLATGKQIEKDLTTAIKDGNYLSWELTQEDTLQLRGTAEIQLRYAVGDATTASEIYREDVGRILKKGAI